jgi:serine/threonine protein phosphatase PrpC
MMTEDGRVCLGCGTEVAPKDRFCEVCGLRQPTQDDRVERDLGVAAGITDRGLRHARNEDALALRVLELDGDTTAVVAVVCDGVSTSDRADQAAAVAAKTAAEVLVDALANDTEPEAASTAGAAAAREAVTGLADESGGLDSAPACTFVSAVVTAETITVAWLGDSRACWLAAEPAAGASEWLTSDDSWALDMVAAGRLSYAEAEADPRSHALTGWLGADLPAEDTHPRLITMRPTGQGVLLLCSDGLWNYQDEPTELAAMVMPDALAAPLVAAKTLVQYALHCGGHDNVTAVVLPFPPVPTVSTRRSM